MSAHTRNTPPSPCSTVGKGPGAHRSCGRSRHRRRRRSALARRRDSQAVPRAVRPRLRAPATPRPFRCRSFIHPDARFGDCRDGHARRNDESTRSTPMRAVTWQGRRKVSVDTVPDPAIKEPTDAIIRVTSTNICGSDLHLYEVLGAFMTAGDILGHEAMGVVEEVGREVDTLTVGDRVVIPFNISCGHCFMCGQGLQSQCETTQNRDQGTGASLFGYSKLYGEVAGGQAEYLRVPQAQYTHIKVPHDGPDERYVYLSDVLPTAWQAVDYANVPDGGTLVILGLGPIGSMACKIAHRRHNCRVIGVDMVPERLQRAREMCSDVIDLRRDDAEDVVLSHTDGRGAD